MLFCSEEKARDALIYSYENHINGFAALLEDEEAAEIASMPQCILCLLFEFICVVIMIKCSFLGGDKNIEQPGVVSVFLNQGKKLHTTHSWEFLMLEKNGEILPSSIWEKARFGQDTIIANLDTGLLVEFLFYYYLKYCIVIQFKVLIMQLFICIALQGVWPESKSFSGKGYGPIPSKWKGICQFNESEGPLCNR